MGRERGEKEEANLREPANFIGLKSFFCCRLPLACGAVPCVRCFWKVGSSHIPRRWWSREAVPARPDGLGAVAGGFPGSGGENFAFPPNHPSSQPLPIEAAVSLDARSGHHLSTTPALSVGARSTPRAHNLSTLSVAWASFPERKSLEILGRPNRESKPVSLEKKTRLW